MQQKVRKTISNTAVFSQLSFAFLFYKQVEEDVTAVSNEEITPDPQSMPMEAPSTLLQV